MVLTMVAVAANKGIQVNRMSATVQGHSEFVGRGASSRFITHLDLGEGLSSRERAILYNSARQCEVHKLLSGEIQFEEHLQGREEG